MTKLSHLQVYVILVLIGNESVLPNLYKLRPDLKNVFEPSCRIFSSTEISLLKISNRTCYDYVTIHRSFRQKITFSSY